MDSTKTKTITMMIMTTIMIITNHIQTAHTPRFLQILRLLYQVSFVAIVPHKPFRVLNFATGVERLSMC